MTIKLDLGAGAMSPDGFKPMGHDHGSEIFPLPYPDESVDEIRASHCLEHFPHAQLGAVIAEWSRVLKKGGRLRIAVPDFQKIAENYANGVRQPTEGYILGGQTDASDFHKSLFDHKRVVSLLTEAGLTLLRPWTSEFEDDCAALPISLNLEGYKPHAEQMRVVGAMSVPRLCFADNMFCTIEAALACNVPLKKHGGAYWDISLTKVMEGILDGSGGRCDAILATDYDSVYTPKHVATLIQLMALHPEADAIAAIQSSRHEKLCLFTVPGTDGVNQPRIPRASFDADLVPVATAHFGLTLIRADKLRALPKPWFRATPSPDGSWDHEKGATHADISFWRHWAAAGNTLFLASRVAIGHAELMIRWPDKNLEVMYQPTSEYNSTGVPEGVWR